MLPVVALVGRPNVGKSTLFNALTRTRDALVHDEPGVTRDRNYGVCRIGKQPFVLVDTGGLTGEEEGIAGLTAQQSEAAIDEATLVVVVVDARDGPMPMDRSILDLVRRAGKPFILAVNKVDGLDESQSIADFSLLGADASMPLSAAHRRGIDELLESIEARLPPDQEPEAFVDQGIRVAIIGRPNVGKSTLVNRLLGEERMIASEVPGTTRDAIEVAVERDGKRFTLIDTAGVRRRARVEETIEKFSVIKTLQALEHAHVAVVMLDAEEGVTDQDLTVLGHALDAGRALVVAANKWDGLDDYHRTRCKSELGRRLVFVPYAAVHFISAKHGSGLGELTKTIVKAHRSATREISSHDLTEALHAAYEAYQPPLVQGRAAKLRYAHMGGHLPPRIIVHGTRVRTLAESYKRYLENYFRKRFKLVGTPVRLEFREGANPFEGRTNPLTERQKKKRQRLIRHVKRR
ncbi:MAG TPA: ribosome biogenesis GTPase Der [Candidatus Saccharimonadia bacterium]|nr:ribosome biogenesis GTPase Der [Candidatus Saccharimonadia bacterium]